MSYSARNWIKVQLEFSLIIALETNEWHFQRAILKSFNMSPHMTMLGHLSHKLYTVVVGQPVFSILSWGVLLRLFVIVPFITTLINEVWPNLEFFPTFHWVAHFFVLINIVCCGYLFQSGAFTTLVQAMLMRLLILWASLHFYKNF